MLHVLRVNAFSLDCASDNLMNEILLRHARVWKWNVVTKTHGSIINKID